MVLAAIVIIDEVVWQRGIEQPINVKVLGDQRIIMFVVTSPTRRSATKKPKYYTGKHTMALAGPLKFQGNDNSDTYRRCIWIRIGQGEGGCLLARTTHIEGYYVQ